MANVEKYNMMQAIGLIAHCERTLPSHQSNPNIDVTRTKDNYALWPLEAPDQLVLNTEIFGQSSGKYADKRLRKRLSQVSYLHRSDVNVLCSWCIHLGVDTLPGYENARDFFKACVRFVAGLYGPENIVYAWVHNDEDTPHIHIGFVPVIKKALKLRKNASEATKKAYEEAVAAGKTTIERVDADKLISLRHLQGWHPHFSSYMTTELGYDPGVHTGITEALGGDLSVHQLKRMSPKKVEERRKRTAAYHADRRAEKEGKKPSLDRMISIADPQSPKNTAGQPQEKKKLSIEDMIQNAAERSGKR